MRNLDKFRGCLVGGAAGDALGYEVEFMKESSIFHHFGPTGISEYVLHDGIARISDDTQMTLFTATGLLSAITRSKTHGIMGPYESYVGCSYRDWLKTQKGIYPKQEEDRFSWLSNVRELYSLRAPGNTCLSALEQDSLGSVRNPINSSKGCGGVMRVAPVGLYFIDHDEMSAKEIAMIGAEVAALTHGHELGYIPAAIFSHMIWQLAGTPDTTVLKAVDDAVTLTRKLFADSEHLNRMLLLIDQAKMLAQQNMNDLEAIRQLGEGWVAEETLAIAIYCALKYENDFDKALIASVNHSGDSDSTGAVTGNILGALLGLDGIPEKYLHNLELCDLIIEVADDLHHDCQISGHDTDKDPVWTEKYLTMGYGRNQEPKAHEKYLWQKTKTTLKIALADITSLNVDCIVNAANDQLMQGGGVCGAVFSAAGAKELRKACEHYGSCPAGDAVLTPGFRLPSKYIAHAVGPVWKGGSQNEEQLLYSCYQKSMDLACHKGCRSIAFPLISSGIYGYPVEQAWRVAIRAILESPCPMDVTIAVISDSALALGNQILAETISSVPLAEKPKILFFWHEYDSFGELSQWYASPFVIEGIRYETAEQYMMAKKALLAGDLEHYVLIMHEKNPAQCKKFGKNVRALDTAAWDQCKEEVVYHANLAKFSQNPSLQKLLIDTGSNVLAEASPYDKTWGIGLDARHPDSADPSKWTGKNLLGKILMKIREELSTS